jgi:hypothetical protein
MPAFESLLCGQADYVFSTTLNGPIPMQPRRAAAMGLMVGWP